MKSCRLLSICLFAVILAAGCSGSTPEKKLLGKWMCTPHLEEAVGQAVQSVAQGKDVNPLVSGAAKFFGQKIAEATMSVEVDFHKGGTVFFRGNTEVLNFPPDSDGSWEVSSSGPDQIELRFGTETRQLEGKVLFRDKDEFTLKLKNAGALAPPSQGQDAAKLQKQPTASLVFKRVKD
jgi:hypothetical protein